MTLSLVAAPLAARGAGIVASNDSDPHPITLVGGGLVPDGTGFVAVGGFSLSDAQIGGAAASSAAFNSLIADFTAFGAPVTFGLAGEGGLFSASFVGDINAGDSLVGQPIFVVAGNAASLAASDQLWVLKSGSSFAADGVDPFNARIELDADFAVGSSVLVGTPTSVFVPSIEQEFEGSRMGFDFVLCVGR